MTLVSTIRLAIAQEKAEKNEETVLTNAFTRKKIEWQNWLALFALCLFLVKDSLNLFYKVMKFL